MNNKFSFSKGWSQLRHCDAPVARKKLMRSLNVNTRQGFLNRMYGTVEPRVTEHESVERIFAEYGITDVWGDAPDASSVTNQLEPELT